MIAELKFLSIGMDEAQTYHTRCSCSENNDQVCIIENGSILLNTFCSQYDTMCHEKLLQPMCSREIFIFPLSFSIKLCLLNSEEKAHAFITSLNTILSSCFNICFLSLYCLCRNIIPIHVQITSHMMGWLNKIFKGSSHKVSEGQYHGKSGDDRIWNDPSSSLVILIPGFVAIHFCRIF